LRKREPRRPAGDRRSFLHSALGLPALLALKRDPKRVHAPSEPESPDLDSQRYTRARYEGIRPEWTFRARTKAEALRWQAGLRQRFVDLLGGFPPKAPLDARTLRREHLGDYRRETVLFWSRPHLPVFCYFLVPDGYPEPGPVMVAMPGHGRGVDDIVGIEKDGTQRAAPAGYQSDFALQLVGRGLAVLALEPLAFGHRRDEAARRADRTSCQPAAGAALMLGETMAGWRVWDVLRAIDYLETRRGVDPRRIGCVGISGGGTATLYAAAVDPRIKLAYVSGSFCTFLDSIYSLSHCIDNYIPGLLRTAEAYDIAGLIAPRHLFAEQGLEDPIFPVGGARTMFERTQRVYRVLEGEERFEMEVFPGKHEFWGRRGLEFVSAHV